MSRSEDMKSGKAKTFYLPELLIRQLEAAAAVRQGKVSEVVREILERNIRAYFEECQSAGKEKLQDAIDAIKRDKELQRIYEASKNADQCIVPGTVIRDSARVAMLFAAIAAYKDMQVMKIEAGELFTAQKTDSHELLDELRRRVDDAPLEKLLKDLGPSVDTGDLVLNKDEHGKVHFAVSARLGRMMDQEQTEILGVRRLRSLLKKSPGHGYPPRLEFEKTEQGRRVYIWIENS